MNNKSIHQIPLNKTEFHSTVETQFLAEGAEKFSQLI